MQPSLCRTWSETRKTGILTSQLISSTTILSTPVLLLCHSSLVTRKPVFGNCDLDRQNKNRAVQPQTMTRGLKFWILMVEGLYYLCSENKGADQLCSNRKADLHLCCRICKKPHFIYTNFFFCAIYLLYWTFKDLSRLTKYTRLGRLPEGKSQVKRFGVSIHHAYTAI